MSLRIALVHPTYWPEVRRGSERLINGVATSLAARGAEVTILTTHPGRSTDAVEDGVRVIRTRRPPKLPRTGDQEYFVETAPAVMLRLLQGDYDLAHAFFPVDAWAAVKARAAGGPPVAFSFHGVPVRQYLVARRRRLDLLSTAVRDADAISVLSEAAAEPFRRYLLRDPDVLPGGVSCDRFEVEIERAERPTLICTASLGDPRKGGSLLLEAFKLVRERIPAATLVLAGGRDPFLSRISLELFGEGIEVIDGDDTAALAAAYASSWASVLPSIGEAFGLVLLESMAAGTPPIALRAGASPELVDGRVGALVEPGDPAALADEIAAALASPPGHQVRQACRARAREFDWSRIADRYEDFHRRALDARRPGPAQ